MISIKGTSLSKINRSSAQYKALQAFHERLKHKDSTIWGPDAQAEASVRMNWIDLPESSRYLLPQFDALASKHLDKSHVILCGMGGSSLGPEVIAQTFSKKLFVLDSTDSIRSKNCVYSSPSFLYWISSSCFGYRLPVAPRAC